MAFWSKKTSDAPKQSAPEITSTAPKTIAPTEARPSEVPVPQPKTPPPAAFVADGLAAPTSISNGIPSVKKLGTAPKPNDQAAVTVPQAAATIAPAPALTEDEINKRAAISKRMMLSLGEIVSVLMHNPQFRAMPLAEVESLVVPAVMTGQFLLAEARSNSKTIANINPATICAASTGTPTLAQTS